MNWSYVINSLTDIFLSIFHSSLLRLQGHHQLIEMLAKLYFKKERKKQKKLNPNSKCIIQAMSMSLCCFLVLLCLWFHCLFVWQRTTRISSRYLIARLLCWMNVIFCKFIRRWCNILSSWVLFFRLVRCDYVGYVLYCLSILRCNLQIVYHFIWSKIYLWSLKKP